jgi:hypothetical protein
VLVEATLEPRLVISDELAGEFFIPAYQRGYRWGREEVTRLLDDIKESGNDADYYLQPVVVLRHGESWEVVDGQQRLTTLYLIVRYLREELLPTAKVNYSLTYATRARSREYLESLDPARRAESIDFHHIYAAYEAIGDWFAGQANALQAAIDLHTALSRRVKVIWYEAEPGTDPTQLFTRLNVGKIPLTDSELIKALVLSSSAGQGARSDRQEQIAAEWNTIERELRSPELWAFLTGTSKQRATHIDLLFETLADELGQGHRPTFWTFERLRHHHFAPDAGPDAARKFWRKVVALHGQLIGWFEDRELFHRIGFLTATGTSFAAIVELGKQKSRSQFRDDLVALIRRRLGRSRESLAELTYEADLAKCREVLLLMNVETVLSHDELTRFSFHAFAAGDWSVEHIHAQNAESLTRADQWATWLQLHRAALVTLPGRTAEENAELFDRIEASLDRIDAATFRSLEQEVVEIFAGQDGSSLGEDVHRLPNLALLSRGINSALGNSVFEVKRKQILERDRTGQYIPPCTRNVFLKYYTDGVDHQLHIWGPQDRDAYAKEMLRLLAPFLTSSTEETR